MMQGGCFVTGTDTGVGKTRISAALLHLLGSDGSRSAGLKPVASGLEPVDGRWVNEDVRLLRAAGTLSLEDAEVGPCQLRTPCAPQVAAEIDGVAIDRAALRKAADGLAARCDWLVVEGVGGFRVPLGPGWDTADLAVDLCTAHRLPVILVVGLRLGCLNHALLTAEAVHARGLCLAGWIGASVDPDMLRPQDTIAALRHGLAQEHASPCLGIVPWLADTSPAVVAAHLEANAIRQVLRSKETP